MTDPKVTLKNLKIAEFASHDSTCFEATVYVDGKKFCTASDDGWGGGVNYHSTGTNAELQAKIFKIGKRFNKNCLRNYEDRVKVELQPWIKDNAERNAAHDKEMRESDNVTGSNVFDHLVEEALTSEQYLKDLKKALSRKVLWLGTDGKVYGTKGVRAAQRDAWIPQIAKQYPGAIILNTLATDEALKIFRSAS